VSSILDNLPEELCPNCGNFVESLNEISGFCSNCDPAPVGVLDPHSAPTRLESWLHENANRIEVVMGDYGVKAKYAIKIVAAQEAVICIICGDQIVRATANRHFICNKKPACKRARRYYKYLRFEKGMEKDQAISAVVYKFKRGN
jgi:endogenous inhibitor of DNA gyrase (YacG/DUF329 family)